MSWAYEKLVESGMSRDDWYIPKYRLDGISMTQLVERAVSEVMAEDLAAFMSRHGVRLIVEHRDHGYICDLIEGGNVAGKIICLPGKRAPFFVKVFGHELGHLYAWMVLGSQGQGLTDPLHFFEEIFAVEFGEKWNAVPDNRRKSRLIFRELLGTANYRLDIKAPT